MTRLRLLILLGVSLIVLLLCVGGAAWWYLFGPNAVSAAELVPSDTVAFATIPNAALIDTGYQTSRLKQLVDSPNMKPLSDAIMNMIGQKNLDLFDAFLPNLSGQSFVALTHFDPDKPAALGFIAGMKPKKGLGNFDAFVEKLKTTWPFLVKQGTMGQGNVAGVDYQWIQGPDAPDKVCVAQYQGWIITTWGEASLRDWVERYQKKSPTPSLAENPEYKKSLARVGADPMTLLYVDYHAFLGILQKQMMKANPTAGDYLSQKLAGIGGAVMATRFENGEIVDRFSILVPKQAQIDSGMNSAPCSFETLKFTGPDTRLYWASTIDGKQAWKNLQDQAGQTPPLNSMSGGIVTALQNWAQGAGLDVQHNMVDPLGSEFSFQVDWSPETSYPEAGLFVKLDKPDDFKPVITAIIEAARKAYATSAVIKEINSNGHNFATLKFIQPLPISPTITEDGPYLGLFLSENQAVRSFQRDETIGLPHNADFTRQIGDKRNGASQIFFMDSPQMLDHAYRTAMPYLSLVSMFNKDLAAMLKGKDLPPDLTWLAPVGTWSFVTSVDDDGMKGYSVSGLGNQGIFLSMGAGAGSVVAQRMGLFPKPNRVAGAPYVPGSPAAVSSPPLSLTPSSSGRPKVAPLPRLPQLPVMQSDADAGPQSFLSVTADGKVSFDGTPVDLAQLSDFLKNKKAANEDLKVAVKADKNVPDAILAQVLAAGGSAGLGVLPVISPSDEATPAVTNSNPVVTPPATDAATNAAPAGSNTDVPPSVPAPTPATNSPAANPDATPPPTDPVKTP